MPSEKTPVSNLQDFDKLLERLHQRDAAAWSGLIGRLRPPTIGWLHKRVGNLSEVGLLSKGEFVLEVFADSLAKFYELFEKGHFEKESDLQSLLFKVCELKMKEGFARSKKEVLLYRPSNDETFENTLRAAADWNAEDEHLRERILTLQKHFVRLDEEEQDLLRRFYEGEKINRIAEELGVPEASMRKRKQRALDRLKQFMKLSINLLYLLWNV